MPRLRTQELVATFQRTDIRERRGRTSGPSIQPLSGPADTWWVEEGRYRMRLFLRVAAAVSAIAALLLASGAHFRAGGL